MFIAKLKNIFIVLGTLQSRITMETTKDNNQFFASGEIIPELNKLEISKELSSIEYVQEFQKKYSKKYPKLYNMICFFSMFNPEYDQFNQLKCQEFKYHTECLKKTFTDSLTSDKKIQTEYELWFYEENKKNKNTNMWTIQDIQYENTYIWKNISLSKNKEQSTQEKNIKKFSGQMVTLKDLENLKNKTIEDDRLSLMELRRKEAEKKGQSTWIAELYITHPYSSEKKVITLLELSEIFRQLTSKKNN